MSATKVPKYWRSLDELEGSPEFQQFMHREFPQAASEFPEGISRRRWMQLMGASFALASVAGCRWQTEEILPFSERPEGRVPGQSQYYATNMVWAGAPRHLLVTCFDGRPIKVEGNPDHPQSLGSADPFSLASTLNLYDPDRSSEVRQRTDRSSYSRSWAEFEEFAAERMEQLTADGRGGEGLAVLIEPHESYSYYDALQRLAEAAPNAKFYEYAPLATGNDLAGAEMAFGEPLRAIHHLEQAKVIAAFDVDLFGEGPESLRLSREYADNRDPDGEMNRLYAVESQYSKSGAAADHRLPVKSSAIGGLLQGLRDKLKQPAAAPPTEPPTADEVAEGVTPTEFIDAMVADLRAAGSAGVVIVGDRQPPESHAIAHEINSLLGAIGTTVEFIKPIEPNVPREPLSSLVGAMAAVQVDTLLILGGNPVYTSPADLDFASLLEKTPHSIHLSLYDNETSRLCEWSLPETHPFEAWGDAVAWDGTISPSQPLIEPLVGGRSAIEVLAVMMGESLPDAMALVRESLTSHAGQPINDDLWARMLHDGLLPDSAAPTVTPSLAAEGIEPPAVSEGEEGYEVVFVPSSSTYDGRLANNGWLQETPDFMTKLVWDNVALMSPETAALIGAGQGELVRLTFGSRKIEMPVFIQPGQAEGSIGVALGYGRWAAGRVGGMVDDNGDAAPGPYPAGVLATWWPAPAEPVGFNTYTVRTQSGMSVASGVTALATGRTYPLSTTQDHHAIDTLGLEETGRRVGELVREATQPEYKEHPDFAHHLGGHGDEADALWQLRDYSTGPAWGMSIDLNRCVGCNACMVACQAENNVPVVGKDQVARGREMHWIRVDRYFMGEPASPRVAYQPLTCMQCETAPCEQVCPVAATVHSAEGLNDMVYNRCVGTRYCANNCPYKVRRFNFFNFNKELENANTDLDNANKQLMQLVVNPEVTVRARGVMEKCTYCVQRISKARIHAKNENRDIRDGEVIPACAQACPGQAINFGDLNDPNSVVAKLRTSPRTYGMLSELMTKPRTTYMARVRNPHPRLAAFEPVTHEAAGHDSPGHDSPGHGAGEDQHAATEPQSA